MNTCQHGPSLCQQLINTVARRLDVQNDEAEEIQLSIVLADDDFIQDLNNRFRGKDKPTNVLSFPNAMDVDEDGVIMLGDVILSWHTLAKESAEQNKNLQDHFSHLLVHGFLHLLGFDHENDAEAKEMESLEIEILQQFDIANPYEIAENK